MQGHSWQDIFEVNWVCFIFTWWRNAYVEKAWARDSMHKPIITGWAKRCHASAGTLQQTQNCQHWTRNFPLENRTNTVPVLN